MAPKKTSKPNAYILFAQELMSKHGRKYHSLKDACEAAGPIWARMSQEQKEPYETRANIMRGDMHRTKYTTEGVNVEVYTAREQEKTKAEESAREQMRATIQIAQKDKVLDKEVFLLIHFNMFCYQASTDRYWPAEVAVAAFNLRDGVLSENVFHSVIKPGPLPIGYKSDAKLHSEQTHLLEVPFDEESNTHVVYENLKEFMRRHEKAGAKGLPVLYADKKHIKMIQTILDSWSLEYDNETDLFKVNNLQAMFHVLRNTVSGEEVWHSVAFGERELEKDVFSYAPEIACPFHLYTPRTLYCSQSIVMRYAFVICDNCCSDLNIDLINGQHVPVKSLASIANSGTSSMSGFTVQSSRRKNAYSEISDLDSNKDSWEVGSCTSNYSVSTVNSQSDYDFPALGGSKNTHSSSRNAPVSWVKNSKPLTAVGSGFNERLKNLSLASANSSGPSPGLSSSDFPAMSVGRGRRPNPKSQ